MQFTAEQGHRYRARIVVGFWKRAFASEGAIAEQLKDAGVEDVQVQKDANDSSTYWAWGSWNRESRTVDLPGEVQEVTDLGKR